MLALSKMIQSVQAVVQSSLEHVETVKEMPVVILYQLHQYHGVVLLKVLHLVEMTAVVQTQRS